MQSSNKNALFPSASSASEQVLIDNVVERILGDLSSYASGTLPCIPELCKAYGMPRTVICQALSVLRTRKVVHFKRGSRIRILHGAVDGEVPGRPAQSRPAERVYLVVKDGIDQGKYRAGRPIPKRQFFAGELGVSIFTINTVLKRLAADGLIHKQGKQWIVGTGNAFRRFGSARKPVIMLVLRDHHSWGHLGSIPATRRFVQNFEIEAEAAGARITPLFLPYLRVPNYYPKGIETAKEQIAKWKSEYVGVLLTMSRIENPDLDNWVFEMARFGKPVVWLDRRTEGNDRAPLHSQFRRLYIQESAVVKTAVKYLADAGHRYIAFANGYLDQAWAANRAALVAKTAQQLDIRYDILDVSSDPLSMNIDTLAELLGKANRAQAKMYIHRTDQISIPENATRRDLLGLAAEIVRSNQTCQQGRWGIPRTRQYHGLATLEQIIQITPVCMSALERGISALIVSNDYMALRIYSWMRLMGIEFPGKISIVSFDNSPALQALPISSVDFGTGYLGYAALRILLEDLPLREANSESIASRPFVMDRSTVPHTTEPIWT